jgi:hypothetical protein
MSKLKTTLLAASLACAVATPAMAADHLDSPTVRTDPAADINDVYAFVNPNDAGELILAATFIPLAGRSTRFSDAVEYRFHIDNGIAGDETTVACRFSKKGLVTCNGNNGLHARGALNSVAIGQHMRVFAGLRDDPFFFDLAAFNTTRDTLTPSFTNPGINFFSGLDTMAIVLGIRSERVTRKGTAKVVKVYASTARVADEYLGTTVQIDRMGRPAINTALIDLLASTGKKDAYNAAADRATWAPQFEGEMASNLAALDTLDGVVGNALLPPATLASVLVDDRLVVDTGIASCDAYLAVELGVPQCGGRTLARDVMDDTLGAVVGPGVSDYVGNDSAFLADFPFLAEPNAAAALKATASPVKAAPARVLRVAPRERAMPRRTRLHGAR